MSVKVMARVWTHSQQKSGELLVMLALADFADDDGVCWPSIPVLAEKARLTERQVQYVLPKLEQAGELQIDRSNGGRNRRNRYVITVHENGANISLKKIHRNNFSEIHDTKTVKSTSPASNRHRTVNMRSAKAQRSTNPEVKEFISFFSTEYQKRRGEPYHVKGGKDGRLVKDLLQTFGLVELKRRALGLLESDDPWISGTDRGIGILASQINKLNGRAEDSPEHRKETFING